MATLKYEWAIQAEKMKFAVMGFFGSYVMYVERNKKVLGFFAKFQGLPGKNIGLGTFGSFRLFYKE